jgi:hypothetical protein
MKQTAVEWLVEEFKEKLIGNNLPNWVLDVIQQAKAMEKEQIMQSLNDGKAMALGNIENKSLEQYYNETYESK